MRVLDVYVTVGYMIENGKKKAWTSRTAIVLDSFKGADGEGEYIRTLKLAKDCEVPDSNTDVIPLYVSTGNNAKVGQFIIVGD